MSFSFAFSGDDIEDDGRNLPEAPSAEAPKQASAAPSAFPVAGKPLLPAASHELSHMLTELPSKIAYSLLDVDLDGAGSIQLPRRELWDVKVQLMAEDRSDNGDVEPGLGSHDVRTGIYEGGFKSWESSIDMVKVLSQSTPPLHGTDEAPCIIELGCGTALPSLALFQWAIANPKPQESRQPLTFVLADYNATVLQLVTLPNFILCWALQQRAHLSLLDEAFSPEGDELELTTEIVAAFQEFLATRDISLRFLSGAWSPEWIQLLHSPNTAETKTSTVILGAETIYSPFALAAFTQTIMALMQRDRSCGSRAEVLVGAKRLYFGVGGSLDDFIDKARAMGASVAEVREETEGVRRGVVRCWLD